MRLTHSHYVQHRNGWGTGFGPSPTHCHRCAAELPKPESNTCSTGYGSHGREAIAAHPAAPQLKPGESLYRSEAHCYACCGAEDEAYMRVSGKAVLYLSQSPSGATVGNWPGSLKLPCRVRKGHHNIARTRYDIWFTHDGKPWHGVQYGDNTQIAHCRRLKS